MGIPAVIVGTDVFHHVYDTSARLGGLPEICWVKVPHPTGSLKDEQVRTLARVVTPLLVEVLTQVRPTGRASEGPITIAGGLSADD